MSFGGSGSDTVSPPGQKINLDSNLMNGYLGSKSGSAYAGQYDPSAIYYQNDNGTYFSMKNGSISDVTGLIKGYQAWTASNDVTNKNWQNYANAVNANEGGQGDQDITSGAAQGQRQVLLGALANAGNPTSGSAPIGTVEAGNARMAGKKMLGSL